MAKAVEKVLMINLVCKMAILIMAVGFLAGCENRDVNLTRVQGVSSPFNPSITGPGVDGPVIGEPEIEAPEEPIPVGTLFQVIRSQSNLSTFADALEFTGLNDVLSSSVINYTVAVPTNAAFDRLPQGELALLFTDTTAFRTFLRRHFFSAPSSAADLIANGAVNLIAGAQSFTDDLFERRDIEATNGIAHSINQILPETPISADPDNQTLLESLTTDIGSRFEGFSTAVIESNPALTALLSDPNQQITIFAPVDEAFRANIGYSLFLFQNPEQRDPFLRGHIIQGQTIGFESFGAQGGNAVQTSSGTTLILENVDGQLRVNGFPIRLERKRALNGIIYIIDTLIIP